MQSWFISFVIDWSRPEPNVVVEPGLLILYSIARFSWVASVRTSCT
jgi:hypothetical protein